MHREDKIPVGSVFFCLNFSDFKWKPTIPPFLDRNGAKTIPFGAAHTYMAYLREYHPTPHPPTPWLGNRRPPCQQSRSFAWSILAYSRKTLHLCMNWVRCFLSMPGMLAGHRPNGRAVACYRRLSCDHQFIYKRTLALEKPVSLANKDWLVQKFGLRRPQRLDS